MTKPKSAPAEAVEANTEDAIVTNTGRVRAETKIKVEDFTEEAAEFDVYSREPEVTVTETERAGRKITIESYD